MRRLSNLSIDTSKLKNRVSGQKLTFKKPTFKKPAFSKPAFKKPSLSKKGAGKRSVGRKSGHPVGLDIESGSIAATELSPGEGTAPGQTAIVPLEPGIVREGDIQDPERLAEALKDLFARHKLGKSVRLGIANQRVVVRTIQLPLIEDPKEIETAVRFRAQDEIPMPLDQAVLDHRVIGVRDGADGSRQMDVLAVAARRDMIFPLLQAMRDAGLQPAGIDLAAFGMIRALKSRQNGVTSEAPPPTTLYCHLGDVTNIAMAKGGECLFTRVSPFGIDTITGRVSSRLEINLDDARELLMEVGLDDAVDLFDDHDSAQAARDELERGASKLTDELRMSMDFYGAQEGVTPVERVVVCGAGSRISGLPERIHSTLGLEIVAETPAALSNLDPEDAARLTVSYGLALED
jgi:type IV pilus assembly protein PilM